MAETFAKINPIDPLTTKIIIYSTCSINYSEPVRNYGVWTIKIQLVIM
jgi:hypothetical protein